MDHQSKFSRFLLSLFIYFSVSYFVESLVRNGAAESIHTDDDFNSLNTLEASQQSVEDLTCLNSTSDMFTRQVFI